MPAALDKAKAASERARALVGGLAKDVEKHVSTGKRISTMRAGDIAMALKTGKAPKFEDVAEIPELARKRAESESRLASAQEALSALERR